MKKIAVISGSSRPNSNTLKVSRWISLQNERFSLLNLSDFNLEHFNEPNSPMLGKPYNSEEVQNWSDTIKQFDGFIFVIPEYNGFFPGIVKDAVDYLYNEWKNKPFITIGLGGRGGKWACEHLRTLLERFEMKFMGHSGLINPWDNINGDKINTSAFTNTIEDVLNKI